MVGASNPAPNALFLEDLQVGQRFSSGFHTIDEAQSKAFAAQFDPQPFHLDGEAAKATLFSGLAASGWHTAAITMKASAGALSPKSLAVWDAVSSSSVRPFSMTHKVRPGA